MLFPRGRRSVLFRVYSLGVLSNVVIRYQRTGVKRMQNINRKMSLTLISRNYISRDTHFLAFVFNTLEIKKKKNKERATVIIFHYDLCFFFFFEQLKFSVEEFTTE